MVANAFRPEDSQTGIPEVNGSEGWTPVGKPATYEVLRALRDQGFTVVNLSAGGVANPFRDVAIARLI